MVVTKKTLGIDMPIEKTPILPTKTVFSDVQRSIKSLVTEAMTARIEELTDVPVVTIEYDGTAGLKNEDVIPYLRYRKKKSISKELISKRRSQETSPS